MITEILNKISVIVFFLLPLSSAFCADDAFEPNNSYLEAKEIEFDKRYSVSIPTEKDYDYFKVKVIEPGYIQVNTQNMPKEVEFGFLVNFFNAKGERIPISYQDNAVRVSSGEYYFAIFNEYRKNSEQSFDISAVFIKEMDKFENNDTIESARVISFNNPYQTALFPAKDYDYFKVKTSEPGYIKINTENMPENISSGFRAVFFNSKKEKIPVKYDDTVARVSAGEYFFAVFNEYRYSSPQLFNLNISFIKEVDSFEPNDSFDSAKELSLNKETNIALYPQNDIDIFKVKAVSSGILSVWLAEPKKGFDIRADFYNTNKERIADTVYETLVEVGNIYYVVIKPTYYHTAGTEKFSFIAGIRENEDVYEPNNTFETAKELHIPSAVTLTVYPRGDADYFKFEIKQEGFLTELVSGYERDVMAENFYEEIFIDVFDANKKKIDSFDNIWGDNNKFKHCVELKPGKYFLSIIGQSPHREVFDLIFDFISKKDFNSPLPEEKKRKDFTLFLLGLGFKDDLSAQVDAKLLANNLGGEFVMVENKGQIQRAMVKAIKEAKGERGNPLIFIFILILLTIMAVLFFRYKKILK